MYNVDVDTIFNQLDCDEKTKSYVRNNLIMLGVGGSHAYGLATETSDVDIRGLFMPSKRQILGDGYIEQVSNKTHDIVIYSLDKALHLIAEQNPNMLELLWLDQEDILFESWEYSKIRMHREKFLSKLSMQKFSGYAFSQLQRIKGHDKWLTREQNGDFENRPKLSDYLTVIDRHNGYVYKWNDTAYKNSEGKETGLYFTKVKDELYNLFMDPYEGRYYAPLYDEDSKFISVQPSFIDGTMFIASVLFNKQQFQIDLDNWSKWKNWKDNRNKVRHELELMYGYDTKHAMHTMRLLKMGYEILNGSGVIVKRTKDRDELLDVRGGKYRLDEILRFASMMEDIMKYSYANSKLPRSVDKSFVVDMLEVFI